METTRQHFAELRKSDKRFRRISSALHFLHGSSRFHQTVVNKHDVPLIGGSSIRMKRLREWNEDIFDRTTKVERDYITLYMNSALTEVRKLIAADKATDYDLYFYLMCHTTLWRMFMDSDFFEFKDLARLLKKYPKIFTAVPNEDAETPKGGMYDSFVLESRMERISVAHNDKDIAFEWIGYLCELMMTEEPLTMYRGDNLVSVPWFMYEHIFAHDFTPQQLEFALRGGHITKAFVLKNAMEHDIDPQLMTEAMHL